MLTEIYVEALLVDDDLADQVWELWDIGLIDEGLVELLWWLVTAGFPKQIIKSFK